jgi:hypothetical protein
MLKAIGTSFTHGICVWELNVVVQNSYYRIELKYHHHVRFQVLTVVSMKVSAFWDIAPCSLIEVDRRFTLMMEAVHTSEMSVYSETTRQYIPEESNLQHHPDLFNHTVSSWDYVLSNDRMIIHE